MIFLSILLIITSSIYFMLSSVYLYLQIFYQSIYTYISLSFSVSIFSISLTLFLHRSPRITLSPFHHFSPLVHPPPILLPSAPAGFSCFDSKFPRQNFFTIHLVLFGHSPSLPAYLSISYISG